MEVYGIPNCDTVKKVTNWLDKNKFTYTFHNFKTEGISKNKLNEWVLKSGWQNVLNLKSATYRKLIKEGEEVPANKGAAIKFMQTNTSSIKRPVIENDGMLIVGLNQPELEQLLTKTK